MISRLWKNALAFGLVGLSIGIGACSSSVKKGDEDQIDAIPPSVEAGTDAVPQVAAEVPGTPTPPPASPTQPSPIAPEGQTSTTPSAQNPAPVEGSGEIESYTIHRGDTLMKIAFDVYGDIYKWKSIYEANKDKLHDPNRIPKGVVLKLEKPMSAVNVSRTGEKYLIKNGDTLGKISNALYGSQSNWKKLWEHNKELIHDPNQIFAGFYLYYLPDGSTSEGSFQQTTGSTRTGSAARSISSLRSAKEAPALQGGGLNAPTIPNTLIPPPPPLAQPSPGPAVPAGNIAPLGSG